MSKRVGVHQIQFISKLVLRRILAAAAGARGGIALLVSRLGSRKGQSRLLVSLARETSATHHPGQFPYPRSRAREKHQIEPPPQAGLCKQKCRPHRSTAALLNFLKS